MIKSSLVLTAFLANAVSLTTNSAVRLGGQTQEVDPDCPCDEVPTSDRRACQCFSVGCVHTVCAQAECNEGSGDRPNDFEGDCCDRCFLQNGKFNTIAEVSGNVAGDLRDELVDYLGCYMDVENISTQIN